ncbi:unnamed protein product [Closterium sp. Naga37s-1]|nr:unnamed protein product [Closterium sp. Naga37s-1]
MPTLPLMLSTAQTARCCESASLNALASPLALIPCVLMGEQEEVYGREVQVADREMVESRAAHLLQLAAKEDVAFLVVGDPFGAAGALTALSSTSLLLHRLLPFPLSLPPVPCLCTVSHSAMTHTDLMLRVRQKGVAVVVVHNASVLNAIGATGLQLYRTRLSFLLSPALRVPLTPAAHLTTLCIFPSFLLPSFLLQRLPPVNCPSRGSGACRGRIEYKAPRYMSVNTAIRTSSLAHTHLFSCPHAPLLLPTRTSSLAVPTTTCLLLCVPLTHPVLTASLAVCTPDSQCIVFGSMQQLSDVDFGPPLHSLVCGALHELKKDFLDAFRVTDAIPRIEADSTGSSEEDESERPIL